MSLAELEQQWRALLLGLDGQRMPAADPDRQRLYRRLVRGNLSGAIRRGVPLLRQLAGEAAVDALIARFLDEAPPKTRLVRQLPIELAAWLSTQTALPHPSAGELAHWEALEIDVVMAPDHEGPALPRAPVDGARVEAHPSARLAAYRHPVHTVTRVSTSWPEPTPDPVILLAWRAGERFVWERIGGGVAKVLVETAGGATVGEACVAVAGALTPPDTFDAPRARAALVDLCRRGALVGFPLT